MPTKGTSRSFSEPVQKTRKMYVILEVDYLVLSVSQPTTCHKFGAMGYSRYGGRVTGTVGLSCSRHMFTLPLGSVDLDGPEA